MRLIWQGKKGREGEHSATHSTPSSGSACCTCGLEVAVPLEDLQKRIGGEKLCHGIREAE